jgi:hypothetical protein
MKRRSSTWRWQLKDASVTPTWRCHRDETMNDHSRCSDANRDTTIEVALCSAAGARKQ